MASSSSNPPHVTGIDRLRGRFVVFDGPDGSGKSTQFRRFAMLCREAGLKVCEVREPGGTDIGEQIRSILLDPANVGMSLRCEMMLYMASRAQLMEEKIAPALSRGELVLADRFISSTLAYQGTAGGMSRQEILDVGRVAVEDRWPDLTVIFDVDEDTAAARLMASPGSGRRRGARDASQFGLFEDRMERQDADYRRRVREGFLEQARNPPFGAYLVVDARGDEDAVFEQLKLGVAEMSHPTPNS